jgi:TRAP-type C4-dicarboxylate transport system substrate-binding protein
MQLASRREFFRDRYPKPSAEREVECSRGKLNEEERDAVRKAWQNRRGEARGAAGGLRAEAVKKFDKDGDGTLNEDEKTAAKKWFMERREKRRPRDKSREPTN